MSGKFLVRLLAITFALSLSACGGGSSSDEDGSLGGPQPGGGSGGGSETPGETDEEASIILGKGEGSSFVEGQIDAGITQLAARGQTALRVSVVDALQGNDLVTDQPVEVMFSSGCTTTGQATINSPIITTSGVAETVYTAAGCAPQDTVTATVTGWPAKAQVVLNIDSPDADRILSSEPQPNSIAPEGTGTTTRPSESQVTFTIVDKNGDPVRDTEVSFRISGDVPGAATPVTLEPTEAVSGPDGTASTLVIAGSESTIVRVIASITNASGQKKESQSPPIAINAMLPWENGFTIAAENFLPDAQFTAGVTVPISVYATDRNGQDVRGDTIINFQTDGGSITPECFLDDEGTCEVTWRSQAPWQTEPNITATTIGETTSGTVGTISQSLSLYVSSSKDPTIELSNAGDGRYCANVTVAAQDGSRIHPPAKTTVGFSINGGTILSTKTTFDVDTSHPGPVSAFTACVYAESDSGTPATLTGTVTTPGGASDDDLVNVD